MTLLYIGNFHPMSVGEREIAAEFEGLGWHVVRAQEKQVSIPQLREAVDIYKPDLILFCKFRVTSPVRDRHQFIADMKTRGIPVVAWLFDLYIGL